jgi:hypothetical protein
MRTDVLSMPRSFLDETPVPEPQHARARRRAMLWGAAIGLATGAFARVWMRTLTEQEPVFSIPGTAFILLAFAAFGACAGLALAWRRQRSPRRMAVQRGVGLVPFLFMGPFMALFLPSLFGALLAAHPAWRRRWRAILWTAITLLGGFFFLASIDRGGIGWLSFAMWLPLSYLMFVSQRIVFEPREREAGTPRVIPPTPAAVPLWMTV